MSNCKTAFFYGEGSYTRQGRESTYFEKNYEPINTVKLAYIKLCNTEKKIVEDRFKTVSEIGFKTKYLDSLLFKSLKNHFQRTNYQAVKYVSWQNKCRDFTRKNVLSNERSYDISLENNNYEIEMALDIIHYSKKKVEVDASYSINSYEILDDDVHFMEYKLILGIFNNRKLIYMDNSVTWEGVNSKRGKKLQYEVPVGIIDSLITKSLDEYYKRMK